MRDPEEASILYHQRRDIFPGSAPVRFIHIEGEEERLLDSPSWFNIDEVEVLIQLVEQLVFDKVFPVLPQNIGIIAP